MSQIEINGVRTYYEDRGSGTPLVLVHGLGGSTRLWDEIVDDLASSFRVIAYDMRGSGQSSLPGTSHALAHLVADLGGLVMQLELGSVLLLGHSMGGTVALAYAAEHPDLVLAVAGLGAPTELPDQGREGLRQRAEAVLADGMSAVAETVATVGTAPSFQQSQPDDFRAFIALLEGNDPAGYAALCRVVADIDITGDLGRISAPVLLVAGELDLVAPPEANEANVARIPNATSIKVEDAGHILPREKPQVVLDAARPFLLEATAARTG